LVERCVELGNKAAAYIGVEARLNPEDFVVLDEYTFGGYGVLAREVVETMKLVGELEGLVLDPVYTGKAMHALIDLARRGALKDPVIFLHTGGAPVLFQYDEEVASLAD
jgi:1-aminocyclopropane-1-carboxylate deaminase/D-cysteine desulfhydrase-like pyridoxal-dependent ACC family enzyme